MFSRTIQKRCYSKVKDSFYLNMGKKMENTRRPVDWDKSKPYETIPGPRPLPILGNTWRIFFGNIDLKKFSKLHKSFNERYGDICAIRNLFGVPDMVFIYSPEDIQNLFWSEGVWPQRVNLNSLRTYRHKLRRDIFGETTGALANDSSWYKFRSVVNPIIMQPRSSTQYIKAMDAVASDFLDRVRYLESSNKSFVMPSDFTNELNKWALESIGLVALDCRLGCLEKTVNEEGQTLIDNINTIFNSFYPLDFSPMGYFCMKLNLPLWKEFVKSNDYFTNLTLKLIAETQQNIANNKDYKNKPDFEKSVFEKLIEKDKRFAMVMALDMLVAGVDTTSKTQCSVLYYIAKNPGVQKKLFEELKKLITEPNSPITKETLEGAKYLKAVIKETTRLAPVSAGNTRLSTKEMVLGGYRIPTGVLVVIPNMFLSTEEKHYSKAKEFIPERWLKSTEGELSYKNTNPFITIPFGFGPRACVGKRIANLELEILTAKIIRNFHLEWPHEDAVFEEEFLYGIKDNFKLKMSPLNS